MDDTGWIGISKRLALGAAYCAAYWLLWHASFDQWFLPAGLRVTLLIFLPSRYWPFLLAGDACALLLIRVPMEEKYGQTWAYISPFLLGSWVAALAVFYRKKFKALDEMMRWIPLIGVSFAAWGTLGNILFNYALSGPASFDTFEKALNFAIGNYLGILLVALPCFLVWLHSHNGFIIKRFWRDSLIAMCVIGALYAATRSMPDISPLARQSLLMLMIIPAVALTLLHGWRGAAIGIVFVNLVIGQTLTYTGLQAARDQTVFATQLALAIPATVLLLLGTKISHLFEHSRQLGISEKQALELARSSVLSGERNLRDKVLYMAQMQVCMDDQRKQLVEVLKENGQYSAAMLLNSKAVEHMQWFEGRSAALYPMHIEEHGLYAVIYPESFTEVWAGSAEVNYALMRGQPRTLTMDLQLVAYRCICNAFALLSECAPQTYRVKLRVWQRRNRRGITIKMMTIPPQMPQASRASTLAQLDLERRVKAYGGAMRRSHTQGVHILLWEPVDADPSSGNLRHTVG
jgi:glucose-6-phosphate-specific signal transduction histidine kinase